MPIIKTDCFILRGIKYKESSKIVTAYSRGYGKLSLLAKGARRTRSKLSCGLDLFSYSEIIFYKRENRELYTVSNAEVIDPHTSIKSDINKFNVASCISELINQLTPREYENEYIFNLLEISFKHLDIVESFEPQLFTLVFGFKLAVLLGFKPMLTHCVVCGKKLNVGEFYFSSSGGGVVCGNCTGEVPDKTRIDAEIIGYMISFMDGSFKESEGLQLSNVNRKKLGFIINHLLKAGSDLERDFCVKYWV